MKLDRLAVTFNDYDFTNDGVPAKSFGGRVVFKDNVGNTTQVNISPAGIDQIMQVVALEVANNARQMLSELTVEAVRDIARPLAITREEPADVEEAEFHESF